MPSTLPNSACSKIAKTWPDISRSVRDIFLDSLLKWLTPALLVFLRVHYLDDTLVLFTVFIDSKISYYQAIKLIKNKRLNTA